MCFHEHYSRSRVSPSSRRTHMERIYSYMQYRKHSAKLWKVRFPCPYINVFKMTDSCICTWAVYRLQALANNFPVYYQSDPIWRDWYALNVKIWRPWLCQTRCILIYDLFITHQMTENTIVLKLITSNSAFEVTNSLYKP